MSGKILIAIVLAVCLSLVGFALIQRSSQTRRIRGLFLANGARLIQRGNQVQIHYGTDTNDLSISSMWRDISQAPGLIHLRATLVDDRYFQWSTWSELAAEPNDEGYVKFRFCDKVQCVEVWIHPKSGAVYSATTKQAVKLIDSSRQAIEQYLKETSHSTQ